MFSICYCWISVGTRTRTGAMCTCVKRFYTGTAWYLSVLITRHMASINNSIHFISITYLLIQLKSSGIEEEYSAALRYIDVVIIRKSCIILKNTPSLLLRSSYRWVIHCVPVVIDLEDALQEFLCIREKSGCSEFSEIFSKCCRHKLKLSVEMHTISRCIR